MKKEKTTLNFKDKNSLTLPMFAGQTNELAITLLKKRLPQVFSCEFCEIFKNTFLHRLVIYPMSGNNAMLKIDFTDPRKGILGAIFFIY